jgi:hypothetical protein
VESGAVADYVDGRFFSVTLLTDERFADAALVFGGLSRDQMAQNRAFLDPLPEGAELLLLVEADIAPCESERLLARLVSGTSG